MQPTHLNRVDHRSRAILLALLLASCSPNGCGGGSDAVNVSTRQLSPDEVKIEGLTSKKAVKAAKKAAIEPDGRPRGERRTRSGTSS